MQFSSTFGMTPETCSYKVGISLINSFTHSPIFTQYLPCTSLFVRHWGHQNFLSQNLCINCKGHKVKGKLHCVSSGTLRRRNQHRIRHRRDFLEEMPMKDKGREPEKVGRAFWLHCRSDICAGEGEEGVVGRESCTIVQFQERFGQVTGKPWSPSHLSEKSCV